MGKFKRYDKIVWQYTHCIGSNYFERVKIGMFIRAVNHRRNYYGIRMASVLFKGNSSRSTIPLSELRKYSGGH